MSLGFFAFHAFWLGSSWLYSTTDGGESFSRFSFLSNIPTLSQDISQQIPIGRKGTVVTILPTIFLCLQDLWYNWKISFILC